MHGGISKGAAVLWSRWACTWNICVDEVSMYRRKEGAGRVRELTTGEAVCCFRVGPGPEGYRGVFGPEARPIRLWEDPPSWPCTCLPL